MPKCLNIARLQAECSLFREWAEPHEERAWLLVRPAGPGLQDLAFRLFAGSVPNMLRARGPGPGALLLRAALGLGRRGRSWQRPQGQDTGVQVHNSLTGRKEPLIVARSDAVSWCVRRERQGGARRGGGGGRGEGNF